LAASNDDLDTLMVAALGEDVRLVYPLAGGGWVTSRGHRVEPGQSWVDVRRHGSLSARVEYDAGRHDRDVVEAVTRAAAAEIDNVALRAELAEQVQAVTESRARLETAHLRERRRIERDLHDGAQQRLLALALELESARLNGDPDRMRQALADATCAPWRTACTRPRWPTAGWPPPWTTWPDIHRSHCRCGWPRNASTPAPSSPRGR
jgi:signal transduction histidine kinase